MTTLTLAIVIVFVLGYLCIALESGLKINKAAIALLMCVGCWTLFMVDPGSYLHGAAENITLLVSEVLKNHLGETSETLFFLMGAMTIVEIVDKNGGFNFVRDTMMTTNKRSLMWRIAFMTFFLSAILDNLTTSIVMIMVLRKLVFDRSDRMKYAALVIIAANSGGAFSPIGDVTTIMLWIKGMITTKGVLTEIFLPSLVSMVVPAFIMQYMFKGQLAMPKGDKEVQKAVFSQKQRHTIFFLGVGGLIFVPIFRYLTNLPPFMGILLVLGLLWSATEWFYRGVPQQKDGFSQRVSKLLCNIDLSTILFFLGILMAVACLEEVGVLTSLGKGLDSVSGGNHYLVTGVIGVISSIVDNVPLVAGCMGMYPIGVVVMGLEKITFGWYLRHITWIVFVGYIAGMATYWLWRTLLFA